MPKKQNILAGRFSNILHKNTMSRTADKGGISGISSKAPDKKPAAMPVSQKLPRAKPVVAEKIESRKPEAEEAANVSRINPFDNDTVKRRILEKKQAAVRAAEKKAAEQKADRAKEKEAARKREEVRQKMLQVKLEKEKQSRERSREKAKQREEKRKNPPHSGRRLPKE